MHTSIFGFLRFFTREGLVCGGLLCFMGLALCLGGCATTGTTLPPRGVVMLSVQQAEESFGPAHSTVVQADGLTRRSWIFHHEVFTPEREVTAIFPKGPFLSDKVIIIPEKLERNYCFYNLFTDNADQIVSSAWEGNFCETVVRNNLFRKGVNSLPAQ